jgi:type II secretion system protein I
MSGPAEKNRRRESRGFTIVEVVLSITILSVGVAASLSAFNSMNQTHNLMKRRLEAMQLANQVLTTVRMKALSPSSDETDTEGEFEGTDYRYEVTFAETQWTGLHQVSIRIGWGDEENPSEIFLYTLQYYGQ